MTKQLASDPHHRVEDLAHARVLARSSSWRRVTLEDVAALRHEATLKNDGICPEIMTLNRDGIADLEGSEEYGHFIDQASDGQRIVGYVGTLLGLEVFALEIEGGARCAMLANPKKEETS